MKWFNSLTATRRRARNGFVQRKTQKAFEFTSVLLPCLDAVLVALCARWLSFRLFVIAHKFHIIIISHGSWCNCSYEEKYEKKC
jgi:hypothetical protein